MIQKLCRVLSLTFFIFPWLNAMELHKECSFLIQYYGMQAFSGLEGLEVSWVLAQQFLPLFTPPIIESESLAERWVELEFSSLRFGDNSNLIVGAHNKYIAAYNVENKKLMMTFDVQAHDLAISADNRHLAIIQKKDGKINDAEFLLVDSKVIQKERAWPEPEISCTKFSSRDGCDIREAFIIRPMIIKAPRAIENIYFTSDRKILCTLKDDNSLVHIYYPFFEGEIKLAFLPALKAFKFKIEYEHVCIRAYEELFEYVATTLNVAYLKQAALFDFLERVYVAADKTMFFILKDNRIFSFDKDGFTLFASSPAVLGLSARSSLIANNGNIEICDSNYKHPVAVLKDAGKLCSLSPDKKWIAAIRGKWVTVHGCNGYEATEEECWKNVIVLGRLPDYLEEAARILLSGMVSLKQLLCIKFLNDLEKEKLKLTNIHSVQNGHGFTMDEMRQEIRSVLSSFPRSVRLYLQARYTSIVW